MTRPEDSRGDRRMGAVYVSVILVEVVVLLGLWAFQTYFG
jgi:hypothetical protein